MAGAEMSDIGHLTDETATIVLLDPATPPPPGPDGPAGPPPPVPADRSHRPTSARGGSERRQIAAVVLTMIAALCCATIVEATVFSGLQHVAAQNRAFAAFRGAVAAGVAPVGQSDQEGKLLELGTPMALLEIPAAGIREVVGEGTTSGVLADGPGHSRTTPFPGQAGTSVIMGRRAAFGGPFERIPRLKAGDVITVTTGQGVSTYQVAGIRRAGDPLPTPLAAGQGRLVLATADGAAFSPSGAVYVDADLTTVAWPSPGRVQAALDPRERPARHRPGLAVAPAGLGPGHDRRGAGPDLVVVAVGTPPGLDRVRADDGAGRHRGRRRLPPTAPQPDLSRGRP